MGPLTRFQPSTSIWLSLSLSALRSPAAPGIILVDFIVFFSSYIAAAIARSSELQASYIRWYWLRSFYALAT